MCCKLFNPAMPQGGLWKLNHHTCGDQLSLSCGCRHAILVVLPSQAYCMRAVDVFHTSGSGLLPCLRPVGCMARGVSVCPALSPALSASSTLGDRNKRDQKPENNVFDNWSASLPHTACCKARQQGSQMTPEHDRAQPAHTGAWENVLVHDHCNGAEACLQAPRQSKLPLVTNPGNFAQGPCWADKVPIISTVNVYV